MYVLFCRDPTYERGAEGEWKFSKSFFPRPCIESVSFKSEFTGAVFNDIKKSEE
jgi:hypothetical protein